MSAAFRERTKMSTEVQHPDQPLVAAMKRAYKEGLGVDYALICQGEVKRVHSQVLKIPVDTSWSRNNPVDTSCSVTNTPGYPGIWGKSPG